MRKKVYVPQFDDIDEPVENNERKLQRCVKCNKESVSLHNGVCFECRQKLTHSTNNINTAKQKKNAPNEELYNKYREEIISNRTFLRPAILLLILRPFLKYGISLILLINGVFFIIGAFFNEYIENSIILIIIGLISIISGIITMKLREKLRHKKFEKYNKSIVKINEYDAWECPSCRFVNDKIEHCERCGVLPILKK